MEKQAEEEYRKYLKTVNDLVGNTTTYLSQLDKTSRSLFGVKFRGVFPSDKIPRLNDLKPYCILNLDKSDEPGSHWVALAKLPTDECLFYDSFGRGYKQIIPIIDHSGNGRIKNTDEDPEQGLQENNCGARCIAFLMVFDRLGSEYAELI